MVTLSRRRLVQSAAAAAAAGSGGGALAGAGRALAGVEPVRHPEAIPPPAPIPGGFDVPDVGRFHVRTPGDPAITLPFSGAPLEGFDVEPSSFTDRRGFTAL